MTRGIPKPAPPPTSLFLRRAILRDGQLNEEERVARGVALLEVRAVLRDGQLNGQEKHARDRALVAAKARDAPSVPPSEGNASPADKVAIYEPLLTQAGWQVEVFRHEVRGRLEAFHPSGSVIMITSDPRRARGTKVCLYMLLPGDKRWCRCAISYLGYVAVHGRTPEGVKPKVVVDSRCDCGKEGVFPTLATADAGILKINEGRGEDEQRELRSYRCPADDRVWHHTSKLESWEDSIPLRAAFPAGRRP
ncbi:hypothetical protein [Streptomyces sp. NPDC018055]|uniref:hypothetical protein n=1 Tax=Streptomyces sp. NPDC018055 TaxID=3365038 RepID=UPI0037BD08BA